VKHEEENGLEVFAWHLARRREPWPRTLTVATPSGGRHVDFRAPDRTVLSSSGDRTALGLGIDVRAPRRRLGGYVVGPRSLVAPRPCEIDLDAPVQPLPGWIADRLRPRKRT